MKSFIITSIFMTVLNCLCNIVFAYDIADDYNCHFSPIFSRTTSIITEYVKPKDFDTYLPKYVEVINCVFNGYNLTVSCSLDGTKEKFIITDMEAENPNNCYVGPIKYPYFVDENGYATHILNENNDEFDRFELQTMDDCIYRVKIGKMNFPSYNNNIRFSYEFQTIDMDIYLEDDKNISEVDYIHINTCHYDIKDRQLRCTVNNLNDNNIMVKFEIKKFQPNVNSCIIGDNTIVSVHFYDNDEQEDLTVVAKTSGELGGYNVFFELSDGCILKALYKEMNIEYINDLPLPNETQTMDTDIYLEDDDDISEVDYIHVNSCQYSVEEGQLVCTVNNLNENNITVKFEDIKDYQNINNCNVNDNSIISVHFYDNEEREDLTVVGKTSGELNGNILYFEFINGCFFKAFYEKISIEN